MPARGPARKAAAWLAALGLSACAGRTPPPSPPPPTPAPPAATGAPSGAVARDSGAVAKPRPKPRTPRRARVDSVALEAGLVSRHAHVPLAQALARRSGNRLVADRVAVAVVREAQRAKLSPSLVAGVLLIENTPMDTTAVSRAGAVGLMQVMPFHAGTWGCVSAALTELDANVCHGTQVLRNYVRRSGTMHMALRRYNGCRGRYATPSCRRYPARVLRVAGSLRREMLATAAAVNRERAATGGGGAGAMASARAR